MITSRLIAQPQGQMDRYRASKATLDVAEREYLVKMSADRNSTLVIWWKHPKADDIVLRAVI
jgi:hypothetical protein